MNNKVEAIKPEDVKSFLDRFIVKARVFGILFRDDRPKNRDALLLFGMSSYQREQIVKSLVLNDYVEGPIADVLNEQGEMWVFGKILKGHEVYIKITLGNDNDRAVCISFHIADHPLTYPFKTRNK